MNDNTRGVLLMNIAMLVFVLNDTAVKAATKTMPLFQVITIRGFLASLGLLGLGMMTRQLVLIPPRRDRQMIYLRNVGEVASTLLFLTALTHMPLANLSAIMQFLPLSVTLASAVVFKDHIGWRRLTAILVGFIGVMLIIRPGTEHFDIWSIVALGAVVGVTVRDLAARGLSRQVPSMTVAFWAAVSVTVMGIIGVLFGGWAPVSTWNLLLLAFAAVNLIIGYQTAVMVMRAGDIGLIAPFRYTSLLWAILLGWIAFGTLPDTWTLIGSAIVIATGLFSLWRERQLSRARATTAIPVE